MEGDGALPAYNGWLAQEGHDAGRLLVAQEEHDGAAVGWFLFRARTLRAAAFFILWGTSSIILGAVPDLSTNADHLLLCFSFLTVGVALLILTVAAPYSPMADRAAARLEGWLMAAMP